MDEASGPGSDEHATGHLGMEKARIGKGEGGVNSGRWDGIGFTWPIPTVTRSSKLCMHGSFLLRFRFAPSQVSGSVVLFWGVPARIVSSRFEKRHFCGPLDGISAGVFKLCRVLSSGSIPSKPLRIRKMVAAWYMLNFGMSGVLSSSRAVKGEHCQGKRYFFADPSI